MYQVQDVDDGYKGARQVALTMLATLKANFTADEIGNILDYLRIRASKWPFSSERMKVIKILGMVNCRADFLYHPKVTSDILPFQVPLQRESPPTHTLSLSI